MVSSTSICSVFLTAGCRLRKIIQLSNSLSARVFNSPRPAESLVCPNSRVILVGEAAHPAIVCLIFIVQPLYTNERPLQPGGYHATAMGFEDAETLGALFSRIQDRDQLARITTAYEDIRHPRATFVHEYESGYQSILKSPQGPTQQVRDERLRKLSAFNTGAEIDEDLILEGWGGELLLITHDASEKVEDWWSQYGTSISKFTAAPSSHEFQKMRISVAANTIPSSPKLTQS